MRHHKTTRKFGRKSSQRSALLRALAVAFIMKEKIKTTEAKAKSLRPFVEKLITHAKKDSLSSKRLISATIGNGEAFRKLFSETIKHVKDRNGGYTRIVKISNRIKDASKMAIIELVK